MQINVAHIRAPAASGGSIDFAVFDAKSTSGADAANNLLLRQLTLKARASGLNVDQSALAYNHNGRLQFFGDKPLVEHLSRSGLPNWTHTVNA